MNTTATTFDLGKLFPTIVANVFETMLTLQADLAPAAVLPPERVSGAIGFGGERVTGTVYLHFPESLAGEATRAMLRSAAGEKVSDGDVNDVVGELSNMIGCGLKSMLNDADISCAVSTPSVIRGAFAVEAPQGVTAELFYFSCLGQRFIAEVHLQLTEV